MSDPPVPFPVNRCCSFRKRSPHRSFLPFTKITIIFLRELFLSKKRKKESKKEAQFASNTFNELRTRLWLQRADRLTSSSSRLPSLLLVFLCIIHVPVHGRSLFFVLILPRRTRKRAELGCRYFNPLLPLQVPLPYCIRILRR